MGWFPPRSAPEGCVIGHLGEPIGAPVRDTERGADRCSGPRYRTSQKGWLDLFTIGWCEGDREPFAAMNDDPRVMEFLPKVLNRPESDALAARIEDHFELHGFGLWAVEVPGVASFVGFVGLSVPSFEARFTSCVEVGCRLAFDPWGRGYATEAARGAPVRLRGACNPGDRLVHGARNRRSRAVMGRLAMTRDPPTTSSTPRSRKGTRWGLTC
jgi:RimJ/RimL family protein N-acetyltransferase